jgi:aldose 1-epimerase
MSIKTYTLRNSHGLSVEFINYGGIVTKIMTPDRNQRFGNVVLGFEDVNQYVVSNPSYYGALIGRYANRLARASFEIDGETFHLAKNDGDNSLHGGMKGFDKVYWDVVTLKENQSYRLSYLSPHLEEGYPGNLAVNVIYSLNDENEFKIEYDATSDRATYVNLTNHCYFNLTGLPDKKIFDHELMLDSDSYTESNASYLPTGKILAVKGATDFRNLTKVGELVPDGFNHNYILGNKSVKAVLIDPSSGRKLEMQTSEPGVQLYTGFYLQNQSTGLCLEAQKFPDSPHHHHFPSTLLKPGVEYFQKTIYRFSVI